jgi:hypothetical protein
MKNLLYHLSFHTRCGICLMLFSMFLTSCDSDDAPSQESLLPPITMTGENTFGCLIDGKYFRPRDGRATINSDNKGIFTIRTEGSNWEIDASDKKSTRSSNIVLHIEGLYANPEGTIGTYPIGSSNGLKGIDGPDNTNVFCRIWNEEKESYQTYLSFEQSGIIEITKIDRIPSIQNIISGNFTLKMVDRATATDTIEVTLGRFDLETISLPQKSWD